MNHIILFLAVFCAAGIVADNHDDGAHHNYMVQAKGVSNRRMLITKNEDIAQSISGSTTTHFDIEVEDATDLDATKDNSTLWLHLDQIPCALTPSTQFNFHPSRMLLSNVDEDEDEGRRQLISKQQKYADFVNNLSILASNPSSPSSSYADGTGGETDFTVMSVNLSSGDVKGLQRGTAGEIRQFSTKDGKESRMLADDSSSTSLKAKRMTTTDRKFTCGIDHSDEVAHHDRQRKLHDHTHHSHHTHSHHKKHNEERRTNLHARTTHERTLSIFDNTVATLPPTSDTLLSTSTIPPPGPPEEETFTLNIVIAIDQLFITKQGSSITSSLEYINLLMSAVNVILRNELGVHLNIVRVDEIDILDDISTLRDGLRELRMHYEGTVGKGEGQEEDIDNGETIHLVHALFGKDIGGGIAFINTVCNSQWGVGLSSGLRGTMNNLDDDAFHDAFMIAHEMGHSLGSGHTFDDYDPPVDTCGDTCPFGLPNDNSATLMSYCNFCSGGLDNIAMTYGGKWDGQGSKSDASSWVTNPQLAKSPVSKKAQRVSHHIWSSLLSKGECIQPTIGWPGFKSLSDPEEEEEVSTSPPTKAPSYFPDIPHDDGRIWAEPDVHCKDEGNICVTAPGIMFDIEHPQWKSFYGISIESMQFQHALHQNMTVEVFTTDASYQGREQLVEEWTKIGMVAVNESTSFTEIVLDTPVMISPGAKQGFYLVTADVQEDNNFFVVGIGSFVSSSTDQYAVSIEGGSVMFDTFNIPIAGYYPTVQAGYTFVLPPSASPTTTSIPSSTPSLSPTIDTLGSIIDPLEETEVVHK